MKSVEVKLNEALAKLEKASATKYKEVCDKINVLLPITDKLSVVEAAVVEAVKECSTLGLDNIDEAKRDYATLFGVAPRPQTTTKEAGAAPINKKNGAVENFIENNPFNEGRRSGGTTVTESAAQVSKVHDKKEKLVASVMKSSNLTEAGARAFLGLPVKLPEGLTRLQQAEYVAARRCGLSEADALVLAKLPLKRR
jgi:hypothetical protein